MAWWKCPVCSRYVQADYGRMAARAGDENDIEGPDCPDCGMVTDGPFEPPVVAVAGASVLLCVGLICLSQRWPECVNHLKIAGLTLIEVWQ